MSMYKDVKKRILAGVLAALMVLSTLSVGPNLFADFSGNGEIELQEGQEFALVQTSAKNYQKLKNLEWHVDMMQGMSVSYQVMVYQNLRDASDPTSGALRMQTAALDVTSASGTIENKTLTVDLDSYNIFLSEGETCGIVLKILGVTGDGVYAYTSSGAGVGYQNDGGYWAESESLLAATLTDAQEADVVDGTTIYAASQTINIDVADSQTKIEPTIKPALKRQFTYSTVTGDFTVSADGTILPNGGASSGNGSVTIKAPGTSSQVTVYVNMLESALTGGSYIYTDGTPVEPDVTVKCGGTTLIKDDPNGYTLTYDNNTKAGTATVNVLGQGTYSGYKKTLTFEIGKKQLPDVSSAQFLIDVSTGDVTGGTLTDGSASMTYGVDYTASAVSKGTTLSGGQLAYVYDVTVTGTGNYTGEKIVSDYKVIAGADNKFDINQVVTARLEKTSYTYDGASKEPAVIFSNAATSEVIADFDQNCKIEYSSNLNAGTATVTITGNEAKGYTGSIVLYYDINRCDLEQETANGTITVTASVGGTPTESFGYTGQKIEPVMTVTLSRGGSGIYTLVKDQDYTVTYRNNKDIGEMTVEISGAGNNFQGTIQKEYEILGDMNHAAVVTIGNGTAGTTYDEGFASTYKTAYTGSAIEPTVSVKMGSTFLKQNTDYDLSFENNVNASTADAKAVAVIKGKGKYAGKEVRATFTISRQNLTGTLSVSAKKTYTGKEITLASGEYTLKQAGKNYIEGTDFEVSYENNLDAGTATIIATGLGNYTGTVKNTFKISKLSLSDSHITVDPIADQTYSGNAIKPAVKVYYEETDGTKRELSNVDYGLEYKDNKDIGQATVTITGENNLTDTLDVNFSIVAKSLSRLTFTVGGKEVHQIAENIYVSDYTTEYTGRSQQPEIVMKDGVSTVPKSGNYTTSYKNATNAGAYDAASPTKTAPYVVVNGIGNYKGSSVTIYYTISPKDITSEGFSGVTITDTGNLVNTGEMRVPVLKVVNTLFNNKVLTKDVDYAITATEDSMTSGEGKIATVTGIGNYTGVRQIRYTIGSSLGLGTTIELHNPYNDAKYNAPEGEGSAYFIPYLGRDDRGNNIRPVSKLKYTDKHGNEIDLVENIDYTVTYQSEAGGMGSTESVVITYTGIGDYYGTLTRRYYVTVVVLDNEANVTVKNGDTSHPDFQYVYNGKMITPNLIVTYEASGKVITLEAGKDFQYTVTDVGPNAGTYVVQAKGIGNYSGTLSQKYVISASDLTSCSVSDMTLPDHTYTGKGIQPDISNVVITNTGGVVLKKDVDYKVKGYENNVTIADKSDPNPPTVIIEGIGNYSGTIKLTFSIVTKSIADNISVVDIPDQIYTGRKIQPSISLMSGDMPLEEGVDYTLAYSNNVNPGEATIVASGIGAYSGKKTVKFRIIGDLSNTDLFLIDGCKSQYDLTAQGTLDLGTGITVKYKSEENVDTSGNPIPQWLDSSYYEIQQYRCTSPGEGELVFVGKNFCKGSQSVSIKVIGNLANAEIVNVESQYDYTGRAIKPEPIVRFGTQVLVPGTDYTLEYGTNEDVGSNNGHIYVKMLPGGTSYYSGSNNIDFSIYYNLSKASVSGIDGVYDYNGKSIEPTPTVSCAGKKLVKDADYTVTYDNNVNAGTASVIISSVNGSSIGNQVINFEIRGINMMDPQMVVYLDSATTGTQKEYTGDYIRPEVMVQYAGKTLRITSDYNVSYADNLNVGTASVTVSGAGSYYGAVTKTFTIVPRDISGTEVRFKVLDAGYAGGNPVVPKMEVTYNGHTLEAGKDFTYSLSNNTAVSTDSSKASVTFTGMGNYKGTKQMEFMVTKVNLSGGSVNLEKIGAVYTGDIIKPNIEVTCPVGDGTTYLLEEGTDYTISYGTIRDVGKYNISIVGKNNFYGSLNPTFTVEPKPITSADITVTIPDMDYTGSEVKPSITVMDTTRGVQLQEGTDYDVSYKNNLVSASKDDPEAAPTVTLMGKGNYGETRQTTFNIGKSLSGAQVRIAPSQQEFVYDGVSHIPAYTVYAADGTVLREDVDYEMVPIDDTVNAGTKKLQVKGIGNYYGSPFAYYTIKQKVASAAELLVVLDLSQDDEGNYSTTYTGSAITPSLKVFDTTISSAIEVDPSNYTVQYVNNERIGDVGSPAYVVVSMKGNYALGSETVSVPFIIHPKEVADFTVKLDEDRLLYTGSEVAPNVTVQYDNGVDPVWTLVNGIDYDVVLEDNVKAGKATLTVVAKGNYVGEISTTFDIVASLKDAVVTIEPQFYTGNAIEPPVRVECGGNVLEQDVDFKAEFYSEDGYTTSGYAIITPLTEYYCDSAKCTFTVSADMSLLRITGYANQYTYTGSSIKPDFVIVDPSGNEISYDKDAVIHVRMTAEEAENADMSTLTEDDCVAIGTITAFIPVELGGNSEVMKATYEIISRNINTCNIVQLNKNTYTGKAIEPKATLLYDGKELTLGTDYTVVYNNNVNPGVATAVVQGKGNYTGSSTLKYNIVSPAMVGLTAQPDSETGIQIKWLRNGKATGYEIYSADHKTKYGTVAGTSFVVNGLKSSTTYTFHVRSYVTAGGQTTYGEMQPVTAYTKVSSTTALSVVSTSGSATLRWDRSNTVGGYEIYRSTSAGGEYKKIASIPNGKGSYTDNKVRSGGTYYYKVRAYKPINGSYVYGDYSKTIAITVK